jgi:serine phosphatase RsbU (regulator of sigma subunit)
LMPSMSYDESSAVMHPGDSLLLHSDGLAEAHDDKREMFGFPRLAEIVSRPLSGDRLIDMCMSELERFTGPGVDQEDDITLVVLDRRPSAAYVAESS